MGLPKDFTEFQKTWGQDRPDHEWPDVLKALWYDAKGDWHTAHEFVDQSNAPMAKWTHAYLHRKEGDEWNAGYWYRQARKPFPKTSLQEEAREILEAMLESFT